MFLTHVNEVKPKQLLYIFTEVFFGNKKFQLKYSLFLRVASYRQFKHIQ